MVAIVSSETSEGLHIALGSILGAFIFASTIITAAVVKNSLNKKVEVPILNLFKEYLFYGIGMIIILLYGFIEDL